MKQVVVAHFKRQLLVLAAVLFGATLLLTGLVPQEAQSKEKNNAAQGDQEKTAQSEQEKKKEAAHEKRGGKQEDPKKDSKGKKKKEKVLDKDPKGNEVASGELLVTYKEEAPEQAKDEAPEQVEGQVEKDFEEIDVQLVSVPEVKDEQDQEAREQALEQKKEELEQDPNVETVEYNSVEKPGWEPGDEFYRNQWGYPKINAPGAWDYTRGSSSVKVAVIDTGIDRDHQDLKGKTVGQWDFADWDRHASDDTGHGTHVAGTIAASTNNVQGVAGTCPNCSLLIADIFGHDGTSKVSDSIYAIDWAVANGANVINMSFNGTTHSTARERAINDAWNKGAVLVGSAGNNGTYGTKSYPAAHENVIAVAATNQDDTRRSTSNAGEWVDVAAPGANIYSTLLSSWRSFGGRWIYYPKYGNMSGTSMAAPHVSGLAGLLASQGYSNQAIRKRIEWTSKDLGMAGKDWDYGNGRIDAYAAVSCSWCAILGF